MGRCAERRGPWDNVGVPSGARHPYAGVEKRYRCVVSFLAGKSPAVPAGRVSMRISLTTGGARGDGLDAGNKTDTSKRLQCRQPLLLAVLGDPCSLRVPCEDWEVW